MPREPAPRTDCVCEKGITSYNSGLNPSKAHLRTACLGYTCSLDGSTTNAFVKVSCDYDLAMDGNDNFFVRSLLARDLWLAETTLITSFIPSPVPPPGRASPRTFLTPTSAFRPPTLRFTSTPMF